MTPAIKYIEKAGVRFKLHRYSAGGTSDSYGEEAALALNLPFERVFKTLVTELNNNQKSLAVAILPVNKQLDLKRFANETGAKKAQMANPGNAEKATGYVVGGISPLGQKRSLPLIMEESARNFETIFFSAGKRGLQIEMNPLDLIKLTHCKTALIAK